MAINPLGAVQLFDWENPHIITAYARETISGGELLFCSGDEDVVSSGTSSFASSDVQVANQASGATFNGIALANATSGATVPMATRGVFILRCDGSVFAGQPVGCAGNEAVATTGSLVIPAAAYDASMGARKIGRALSQGASGNFAVIDITG